MAESVDVYLDCFRCGKTIHKACFTRWLIEFAPYRVDPKDPYSRLIFCAEHLPQDDDPMPVEDCNG